MGKTALILALWFGSGLAPWASGTFGTMAALPLVLLMDRMNGLWAVIFLCGFTVVAVLSAGVARKLLGRDDPGEIVIDEVAGFLLALFLIPATPGNLLLGFLLFRFFDILKPFPIKRLERIEGGKGIVFDDLLAGIYANLSLRILHLLL